MFPFHFRVPHVLSASSLLLFSPFCVAPSLSPFLPARWARCRGRPVPLRCSMPLPLPALRPRSCSSCFLCLLEQGPLLSPFVFISFFTLALLSFLHQYCPFVFVLVFVLFSCLLCFGAFAFFAASPLGPPSALAAACAASRAAAAAAAAASAVSAAMAPEPACAMVEARLSLKVYG